MLPDTLFPAFLSFHTRNCLTELHQVRQSNMQLLRRVRVGHERMNRFLLFLLAAPLGREERKTEELSRKDSPVGMGAGTALLILLH